MEQDTITPINGVATLDEQAAPAANIEEELLVEEISIDGMCGVY